jgi:hypothetical protein
MYNTYEIIDGKFYDIEYTVFDGDVNIETVNGVKFSEEAVFHDYLVDRVQALYDNYIDEFYDDQWVD